MAATSNDTVAPVSLKIDGATLDPSDGSRLLEFKVRNSLLAPDAAQVRIADPERNFIKGPKFKLGKSIEILAGAPDDPNAKTIFKGIITTLEPEYAEGVVACFRAYDESTKLTRGRQTRVFNDVLATDAMKTILAGAGFSPTVEADSTTHKWLQQTEESDWDFLWRVARSLDYVMVVDGENVKVGPLDKVATDATDPLVYGKGEMGRRLFSFSPAVSAAQVPEKVVVVAHDEKTNQQWEATAKSFDQKLLVESQAAGSVKSDGAEIYGNTNYRISTTARDQGEVDRKAKAVAARLLQTVAEATGIAEGRPDLKAGARITVEKVDGFSGKYIISETLHVYRGGSGYKTHFTCSGPAVRSLGQLMTSGGQSGASSNGNGSGSFGDQLVLAEVTNNNDPDNMGRVKVKFNTIRDEKSPSPEGWWARIASPSTGKNRGLLMLPQPGEEVLVGFEQGDTSKPLVVGSLWNGKATPGDDLVRNDGSFSLVSDKQILMKSAAEIEIESAADYKLTVAGNSNTEIGGSATDKVTGNRDIKTSGATTIESSGQMKIKAGAPLEIQAPMITVQADAKLDLSATMVNITGSGMVVIDGGIIKLG